MYADTPMYCTGLVMRNSDTAIGNTSAVACGEHPRRVRATSIIDGSVASEDCVLAAITCDGRIDAAKRRSVTWPHTAATKYSPSVTMRYSVHWASTYHPSTLITPTPACTHTAN